MSFAEIERFAADLKSSAALRAEAEKAEAGMAPETPLANAIVFAATKGYAFTADDMKAYVKARARAAGRELTDAQLGGIVGGTAGLPWEMDEMRDIMRTMPGEPLSGSEARAAAVAERQAGAQSIMDRADAAASRSMADATASTVTGITAAVGAIISFPIVRPRG